MLRKTLTILSLIGLLLSVALWGAQGSQSVHLWGTMKHIRYIAERPDTGSWFTTNDRCPAANWERPGYHFVLGAGNGHVGMVVFYVSEILTLPGYDIKYAHQRGAHRKFTVALWPLCLVFSALPFYWYVLPFLRRRKRKKVGLCLKCGYDLRGSKERCPECGAGVSSEETTQFP